MAWLVAVNMNIRLPALTPNSITWFEGLQASPSEWTHTDRGDLKGFEKNLSNCHTADQKSHME